MPLQPSAPIMFAGTPLIRFASRIAAPVSVEASKPQVLTAPVAVKAAPSAATAATKSTLVAAPQKIAFNPNVMLTRAAAQPMLLHADALKTGIHFADFVLFRSNVDRSQLTVPVAPAAQVSGNTVFEAPKDPSKRYFLMGYQVDEETTTRGKQFAVRMLARPQGWTLSVTLKKAAPDAIVHANPGASELPHRISLRIRYKQRVNGVPSAVAELPFTETSADGDKIRGTLAIDSLARSREIHEALTHPELNCELVVWRQARVGIPVPQPPRRDASGAVITGAAPAKPLYRETDVVIELNLKFTFDDTLDRYIFEGLGSATGGSGQGLLRKQIAWNGETHIYYQDDGARNLFYYLPDTFKIARHPDAPHQPLMSVRFDSPDGTKEKMEASFSYCALPVVNRDRLTSALPEMKSMVPADILQAAGGIELEPLLPDPDKVQLKLAYPGADTQGGPFGVRPQAQVHFIHGIVDALTLSLDQFRALYNAMFSTGQLLFTGSVAFEMGGTGEQVSFQLRMFDTAEPFGTWTQTPDGDDVVIRFANEVESPLRVRHLDAIVTRDNNLQVKPLTVNAGAYPVDIQPAESAAFRLPQAAGLILADVDLSEVECVADPQKILNLIMDPSTVPAYLRPLTVKTFRPIFAAPADHPENQVMSVVVDFENGPTVELTADHLEAAAMIPVPIAGFIAGKSESLQYRYKTTVARLNGVTTDADWRTGESGFLFPVLR